MLRIWNLNPLFCLGQKTFLRWLVLFLLIILCFTDLNDPVYASTKAGENKQEFKITNPQIELTDEERAYLKKNPKSSIAMLEKWSPFSFKDKGTLKGFSVDLIHLIEKKTGLTIELVPDNWPNCLTKFKLRKVDIIDGAKTILKFRNI